MSQIAFYEFTAEQVKMTNIISFFKNRCNLEILQEFISKENKKTKDKLSLRLVDWFVTNYAKQFGVIYDIRRPNGKIIKFFVWIEYQSWLDSEGKSKFDPFRRGKNSGKLIDLEYEEGKTLQTTLAQLNFFRWAIKNGIIDYVRNHTNEIYQDMCNRGSNSKKTANGKKRQLSVSVSKTLGKHIIAN